MSETRPPENSGADGGLSPLEPAEPVGGAKPKTDVLFFVLGFFTAPVAFSGIAIPGVADDFSGWVPWIFGAHFAGSLAMLIVGRQMQKARLRSYGLGGVLFYAVLVGLLLLLFGSCLLMYRP